MENGHLEINLKIFDPTYVPVRVTINKLNFFPKRKMPHFISVLPNCGGLSMSKPYISVVFFYPFLHCSPCFPNENECFITEEKILNSRQKIYFILTSRSESAKGKVTDVEAIASPLSLCPTRLAKPLIFLLLNGPGEPDTSTSLRIFVRSAKNVERKY